MSDLAVGSVDTVDMWKDVSEQDSQRLIKFLWAQANNAEGRLDEWYMATAQHIVNQAAEIERLRKELATLGESDD